MPAESRPEPVSKLQNSDGGSGPAGSPWLEKAGAPSESPLSGDTEADVCVVGAGIGGMTTAYLLAMEGKSVVVLESGIIGGGETGRTTAHLTNALDDRYFEIQQMHGEEASRLVAESHTAAISRIDQIVKQERIDCDYERLEGYLFAPPGEATEIIDRELEAAHRAGLVEVARVQRAPLDFDTGPCLRFPRQGQFHPLKYLHGLRRAIERNKGRIFESTHAEKIEGGSKAYVGTRGGPIVSAKDIVVATNTPINELVAIHTKQAAYRTYVVGLPVPRGSVTKALYWDTPHPYHYLRLLGSSTRTQDTHDLLIVGGEDHKTGQEDDAGERYSLLERWTRDRFSMAGDVAFRWSGQVMETVDGLAFIGRNARVEPNVYIITGDSGMGMTHCTIAGLLLTDLIMGRENPWTELYDPSRKTVSAAPRFLRENLNVIAHYAERVTGGEVDRVDATPRGSGSVVRRGLTKIAVYRDGQGELHQHSAVCPHLGCIVAWNSAERTWDCPCHGSRFDPYGRVINGPAYTDLPGVEPEQKRARRTAR